jgi:hypothetical protein
MSVTQESGAYLGGIGVMLEVSNVCAACGQVHEGRKFGLKHRAPRECPRVVMGRFPVVSLPSRVEEAPVKVPSQRKVRESGLPGTVDPLSAISLNAPRSSNELVRGRALGVPWLPPPDLGEVY